MDKLIHALIFFLISATQLNAQTKFRDYAITDKYIYGLNNNNEIKIFSKLNGKIINREIIYTSTIESFTTDKLGAIIITDKLNEIRRYNDKKATWELIYKSKNTIFKVLFDTKNNCYAITNKGVEDAVSHKIYYSNKSLNNQRSFNNNWAEISCCYVDKYEKIWIGFAYGEWGGNLLIFNLKNKAFQLPTISNNKLELLPVNTFFEDNNSVYLSSGLAHLSYSGSIIRFDNLKATALLKNISYQSIKLPDSLKRTADEEYIQCANYNTFSNSIYFYSQNGFFTGNLKKDLSKIENWEFIIKPQTQTWYSSSPTESIQRPMTIYKLDVLDKERFIFLSQNDGIGYYDGSNITFIQ